MWTWLFAQIQQDPIEGHPSMTAMCPTQDSRHLLLPCMVPHDWEVSASLANDIGTSYDHPEQWLSTLAASHLWALKNPNVQATPLTQLNQAPGQWKLPRWFPCAAKFKTSWSGRILPKRKQTEKDLILHSQEVKIIQAVFVFKTRSLPRGGAPRWAARPSTACSHYVPTWLLHNAANRPVGWAC